MILYLDTSSLVKLYVPEDGSAEVRELAGEARVVATASVAYPEARSAFARLQRGGFIDDRQLRGLREALDDDWDAYLRIQVTGDLCLRAGDLAERHGLRGFDSIHLAAYLELHRRSEEAPVHFSAFDDRLNLAAGSEGPPSATTEPGP